MENQTRKNTCLITGHEAADFDAFGSLIAANALFQACNENELVTLLWPGTMDSPMQNVVKNISVTSDDRPINIVFSINQIDIDSIGRLVVVDTKSPHRLKHIQPVLDLIKEGTLQPRIYVYDHHPDDQLEEEDKFLVDKATHVISKPEVGCASTILVQEIIRYNSRLAQGHPKIELSKQEATFISLGIYEDTGSFSYQTTSAEDFEAALYLKQHEVDNQFIYEFLNKARSTNNELKLTLKEKIVYDQLESNMKQYTIHDRNIIITESVSEEFLNISSMVTDILGKNADIQAVFGLLLYEDRVSIIGRARSNDQNEEQVHVGNICKLFGGGGHPAAASATLKGVTLPEVHDELYAHLYSNLSKPLLVKNFMTYPAIVLPSSTSVEEALDVLEKRNFKRLPLVDEQGNCVGIIDKYSVSSAIDNEAKSSLLDLAQTDFTVLNDDDTMDKAAESILRKGESLLPIVSEGMIVGVLTRSDMLAWILSVPTRFSSSVAPNANEVATKSQTYYNELMKAKYKKVLYNFVKEFGQLANSLSARIYLTGKSVLSLLQKTDYTTLDIVIDGEKAQDLISQITEKYNVQLQDNNCFVYDSHKIKLTVAALDNYPHSEETSVTDLCPLKAELYRRHFTIFALAISLNEDDFGMLFDYFNALVDVEEKQIRVLRHFCFMDNPQLIFKAAHLVCTQQYSIVGQTDRLIKSSLNLGSLKKLSGNFFQVLEKYANYPQAYQWFEYLQNVYHVWQYIHPSFKQKFDLAMIESCKQIIPLSEMLDINNYSIWKVYCLALSNFLNTSEYSTFVKYLDGSNFVDWIAIKNFSKFVENKIKQEDIEFPNISQEGLLYITTLFHYYHKHKNNSNINYKSIIQKLINFVQ